MQTQKCQGRWTQVSMCCLLRLCRIPWTGRSCTPPAYGPGPRRPSSSRSAWRSGRSQSSGLRTCQPSRSRSGANCIKIGLPGKSILGDYFQENRSLGRSFLLLRISFPGRPIFIQFVPAPWTPRSATRPPCTQRSGSRPPAFPSRNRGFLKVKRPHMQSTVLLITRLLLGPNKWSTEGGFFRPFM